MNRIFFIAIAVASLVFVDGCPRRALQTGACASDLDCPENTACNAARGVCACIDNAACNPDEFCNVQGACQPLLQCVDNDDCRAEGDTTSICDVNTGGCVSLSPTLQCLLDSQCPFGAYCENNLCHDGCRDDGDCALGAPCIDGVCDPTPGACSRNAYCEFGQICDTASHRCENHPARTQLCSACDPTDVFGGGGGCSPDECLIDPSVAPTPCTSDAQCGTGTCSAQQCLTNADCGTGTCEGAFFGLPGQCSNKVCKGYFCGANGCDDETDPCPRGYKCYTLQIVSNNQCTPGSGTSECGAPRSCNGGGENEQIGFCSCADDSDCPVGSGATCQNPGPNGACIIGTTCAPADGLLCEDLR